MKMKSRILPTLLAIMLVLCSMPISVSAARERATGGSIIIRPSSDSSVNVANKTFDIYKIFDATVSNVTDTTSATNVSYLWYIPEGETQSPYYDFFFGTWTDTAGNSYGPVANTTGLTESNSCGRAVKYINDLKGNAGAMHQLASSLNRYVVAKGITETQEIIAASDAIRVEFTGLEFGYYLVLDNTPTTSDNPSVVRSAPILASATPEEVVYLKASKPVVEKTIVGLNATGNYFEQGKARIAEGFFTPQKGISATIGDTVSFAVTITVPDISNFHTEYIFELVDTVPMGMPIEDGSVYVYSLSTDNVATLIEGDHSVNTAVTPTNTPNANYWFNEPGKLLFNIDDVNTDTTATYPAGTKIVVLYRAKLTGNASLANTNIATLEYSSDPMDETAVDTVSSSANVYTYQFTLGKYAADASGNGTSTRLTGAAFEMHDQDGTLMTFFRKDEEVAPGITIPIYILAKVGDKIGDRTITEGDLVSNIDTLAADVTSSFPSTVPVTSGGRMGQIIFRGLGAGTYELKETKAPDGYKQAQGDFTFTIEDQFGPTAGTPTKLEFSSEYVDETGAKFFDVNGNTETHIVSARISNMPGSVLPSTGGMGTTLFIVIGAVAMAGAAVCIVLISKKKKKAEK